MVGSRQGQRAVRRLAGVMGGGWRRGLFFGEFGVLYSAESVIAPFGGGILVIDNGGIIFGGDSSIVVRWYPDAGISLRLT